MTLVSLMDFSGNWTKNTVLFIPSFKFELQGRMSVMQSRVTKYPMWQSSPSPMSHSQNIPQGLLGYISHAPPCLPDKFLHWLILLKTFHTVPVDLLVIN